MAVTKANGSTRVPAMTTAHASTRVAAIPSEVYFTSFSSLFAGGEFFQRPQSHERASMGGRADDDSSEEPSLFHIISRITLLLN